MFKTNVLRNSNTEIKGKLSLRSSYSNDFFNMPDKIFQEQEELEKKKEASDFECFFFVAHLCQFTGTPQISHRFLTDFIRIIKSQILSEKGLIEWILFFQCRKKPTQGA